MSLLRGMCRKRKREQQKEAEHQLSSLLKEQGNQDKSGLTNIEVHGYMMYECECCGQRVKMFLEKGLEDKIQDSIRPELHKPVPFVIKCRKCSSGMMKHVDWGKDRHFENYIFLPNGCSYFQNTKNCDCGVPVIV